MSPTSTINALTRLARAELAFLRTEFLAPVVRGCGVTLCIANVRCCLRVLPADYRGWGVFRPISHACAQVVRVPSAHERRRYLDLFPAVRLIVVSRDGNSITAIAANGADRRFDISGPAVINLAFGVDLFDTILARFDGSQFWFDEVDPRADPAAAAYLRRELANRIDPNRIARPELTQAHRQAYALRWARRSQVVGNNGLTFLSPGICVSHQSRV